MAIVPYRHAGRRVDTSRVSFTIFSSMDPYELARLHRSGQLHVHVLAKWVNAYPGMLDDVSSLSSSIAFARAFGLAVAVFVPSSLILRSRGYWAEADSFTAGSIALAAFACMCFRKSRRLARRLRPLCIDYGLLMRHSFFRQLKPYASVQTVRRATAEALVRAVIHDMREGMLSSSADTADPGDAIGATTGSILRGGMRFKLCFAKTAFYERLAREQKS